MIAMTRPLEHYLGHKNIQHTDTPLPHANWEPGKRWRFCTFGNFEKWSPPGGKARPDALRLVPEKRLFYSSWPTHTVSIRLSQNCCDVFPRLTCFDVLNVIYPE